MKYQLKSYKNELIISIILFRILSITIKINWNNTVHIHEDKNNTESTRIKPQKIC